MAGSFTSDALEAGFLKMVDKACVGAAARMTAGNALSAQEKQGVEGLLCESMTFVAELVTAGKAGIIEVGAHIITNGVNLSKLTKSQQIYCNALKAEIALNSAELALVAWTTFVGASAAGTAGIIAGGIQGTVVAGPYGTGPGAIAGGIVGAGGPLLLGSIEMYDTVATITDLAIDLHSQCGPLAMTKALSQSDAARDSALTCRGTVWRRVPGVRTTARGRQPDGPDGGSAVLRHTPTTCPPRVRPPCSWLVRRRLPRRRLCLEPPCSDLTHIPAVGAHRPAPRSGARCLSKFTSSCLVARTRSGSRRRSGSVALRRTAS
jgi:hypothetical protein